jgi:hypothetical protein
MQRGDQFDVVGVDQAVGEFGNGVVVAIPGNCYGVWLTAAAMLCILTSMMRLVVLILLVASYVM